MGLTSNEMERLSEAFDILVHVFEDIRDRRGCSKESKRLDTVLSKLDNLIIEARRQS